MPLRIRERNQDGIPDHTRADDELIADRRVHNEVQITHTIARFRVGQTDVRLRKHVQAGRQDLDAVREDAQLATLRTAREAADADDVSTTHLVVDLLERLGASLVLILTRHHLDLLAITLERVEEKLLARGTLQNDTSSNRARLGLQALSILAIRELLDELGNGVLHLEFVGVIGLTSSLSLLHDRKTILKVFGGVHIFLILFLGTLSGRSLRSLRGLLGGLFSLLSLHFLSSLQLVLTQLLYF